MAITTARPRAAPTTRTPALDGLRAIGIALVFLYHARIPGSFAGRVGVDVFFPLSGFLITTLLLREFERHASIELTRFYLRRAARLYPALLVTVALTFICQRRLQFGSVGDWGRSAGLALSYTTNGAIAWFHHNPENALSPTWSLALEEQFYLVWPLVLLVALRRGVSRRSVAILAGLIALVGWSVLFTAPTAQAYFRPDARVGGLMTGCIAALILNQATLAEVAVKRLALYGTLLGSAAFLFAANGGNERLGNQLSIPLVSIATAMLIPSLLKQRAGALSRALSVRPLVWVGQRSYGLYLVHLPVVLLVRGTGAAPLEVALLGGVASLAIATLMFRFVEQPVLAWRDRAMQS